MADVTFSVKINGNTLEIIPDGPVQDNSIYEITLDGLKALYSTRTLADSSFKVYTKMTPAYCSLEGVKSLVETIDLPDDKTLYYIRESSRKADYLAGRSFNEDSVPFEVNQFVKYRAAHDTLLKFFIDRTAESGLRGKMGEVEFETSDSASPMQELLKYLKGEADRWERDLTSESYYKGAAPKAVTRSNPAHYTTRVSGFGREVT